MVPRVSCNSILKEINLPRQPVSSPRHLPQLQCNHLPRCRWPHPTTVQIPHLLRRQQPIYSLLAAYASPDLLLFSALSAAYQVLIHHLL